LQAATAPAEFGRRQVQSQHKTLLDAIICRLNYFFEGQLTDSDKLVYVNNVLKGQLLESELLQQQAASNSKEQFANSAELQSELTNSITNSIINALDAHPAMGSKALNNGALQLHLMDFLLNQSGLWEGLRERAAAEVDSVVATEDQQDEEQEEAEEDEEELQEEDDEDEDVEDGQFSNDQLTLTRIPDPDGGISDWERFAHSINGYEVAGSFEACADLANNGTAKMLTELRCALFFEARRMQHSGGFGSSEEQISQLLRRIREKVQAGELD
jgi:hypothetical protein